MNAIGVFLNTVTDAVQGSGLPLAGVFGIACLLVMVQALFAGYETGVVSANPIRVNHLAQEGSVSARIYSRLVRRRDRLLILTLVGTNIAVVWATILVASRIGHLRTTLILVPFSLVFGEIIAKSMFRHHATRLVLAFVYPLRVIYFVLFPVVACATALSNRLLMLLTGKSWQDSQALTREELRLVFTEGLESGAIEPEEQEMIHSVIELGTTMVKEIMVPRTRMVAVSSDATQSELVELFRKSGYSRMPVFKEHIDSIVGIVNVFDIIKEGLDAQVDGSIEQFMRPAYYVPDTKRVGEVLQELRAKRIHMAIVVDEYGGTDGLVTLEDAMEEIFGEIQDEYDAELPSIAKIEDNVFVADAELDIEEAEKILGLKLPHEDAETMAGFILNIAGKIPAQGETVQYGNVTFTVVEADEHSVSKVRITLGQESNHGG
jgi:CBS domain containing-hemolysin-like protein